MCAGLHVLDPDGDGVSKCQPREANAGGKGGQWEGGLVGRLGLGGMMELVCMT